MQIFHAILTQEFAGSERYAASLARLQAAQGHQVRILLLAGAPLERWTAELHQNQPNARPELLVLPRWASLRTPNWLGQWVVGNYARGFGAQIFHSHLGRAHRLLAPVARRLKIPHVATMHLRYKKAEHAPCDALIAISDWQLAEIPNSYQGLRRVIWNWVTETPVAPPTKSHTQKDFTFGSIGRLHPQKGMTNLVAAFQQTFPNHPGVKLEIVGEGPERSALEQQIGNDSRIRLLGYQAQVAPCYARWQAYVSASRHEPFGLTILEAMAHGLPLVCTRTEGPSDFLKPQPVVPHWADVNDVASLARAMQDCHAAQAHRVAWDMAPFDPARAAAQIENLYDELLHRKA